MEIENKILSISHKYKFKKYNSSTYREMFSLN